MNLTFHRCLFHQQKLKHLQIFIRTSFCTEPDNMDLKTVSRKLNKLAPTTLAGSWDNVGLLVEPTPPHTVERIFLTNDLTEVVMEEAIEKKSSLILAYHPPIFRPLKRLTQRTWKESIIIKCLENRIAVYSPHTCFDAVVGGVNDWLISPFCSESTPVETVQSPCFATPGGSRLEVNVPEDLVQDVLSKLCSINGATLLSTLDWQQEESSLRRMSFNCTEKSLPIAVAAISQFEDVMQTMEILQLTKPPVPQHGPGRIGKFTQPTSINEIVAKVKSHLKLEHLRLAVAVGASMDSTVKTIAVCAGSGSSVLGGVKADVYLTGEMSHHEVLDANHGGTTVILCDHSNTERGFLSQELKGKLESLFENKISVIVSERDRDPLQIV